MATPVMTTVIQPPSANFSTNVTTRMLPVTRSPKQERAMRCNHLRSPRRARHQYMHRPSRDSEKVKKTLML